MGEGVGVRDEYTTQSLKLRKMHRNMRKLVDFLLINV
jgi:hypothetical protein